MITAATRSALPGPAWTKWTRSTAPALPNVSSTALDQRPSLNLPPGPTPSNPPEVPRTLGALLGEDVVTAQPGAWVFKPRGQWHTFGTPARRLVKSSR